MINGAKNLLTAVKNAFSYSDFLLQQDESPVNLNQQSLAQCRQRLCNGKALRERESLKLLGSLGFPSVRCEECDNEKDAVTLAEWLGFPVALKTAADDIHHKSDVEGVVLDLKDATAVRNGYQQLSRIGSRVVVAQMVEQGVEVAFGMVNDPQFGPIVVVGAGGTLVEVANDKCFALPPFGPSTAQRLLESLAIAPLFRGVRGRAPVDLNQLAEALSQYSVICHSLGDLVVEMDLNPVIVTSTGCTAADAVILLPANPQS